MRILAEKIAGIACGWLTVASRSFISKETETHPGSAYPCNTRAVAPSLSFIATGPRGIPDDEPVPVVIFGHALVTDRRFLLTVAGELSKRGFAAVAVDFPYHGDRTVCVDTTLGSNSASSRRRAKYERTSSRGRIERCSRGSTTTRRSAAWSSAM